MPFVCMAFAEKGPVVPRHLTENRAECSTPFRAALGFRRLAGHGQRGAFVVRLEPFEMRTPACSLQALMASNLMAMASNLGYGKSLLLELTSLVQAWSIFAHPLVATVSRGP